MHRARIVRYAQYRFRKDAIFSSRSKINQTICSSQKCNLLRPSRHRSREYATICACIPEPRNGVRADGSGRLSKARDHGPSEIGPDPIALLPRKLGQGIPALRKLRLPAKEANE